MKQDFRTGLLDTLTAGELSGVLHHHRETWFQKAERQRLHGLRVTRLPRVIGMATAAAFTLNQPPGGTPCGPESGFIWLLRKVVVVSSVANDTALYQLYTGSDFAATPNQVLDQGPFSSGSLTYSAFSPIAVGPGAPVSATAYVNVNQFPVSVNLTNTGGISAVQIGQTTATLVTLPAGVFNFKLPPGWVYEVTWTVTQPTATTGTAAGFTQVSSFTANPAQGFQVGSAYYPGNKAAWIWPDEQVYATLTGANVNNQYSLSGIALEVPAELQGKLVG